MDDHQGYVDALTLFVNEDNDVALVGSAATAREGLDLLGRIGCDVVVVAHQLLADGPSEGADVVTAIRSVRADLPILLLVGDGDHDASGGAELLDVVAAGVCGWVDRSSGLEALLGAVRDVARGESHLPTEQVQALLASRAAQRRAASQERMRVLTDREEAVLRALAAGLSRAEIGTSLDLSPNTVRTHVRSILRKYHVHSAPDAVALLTQVEPSHD